MSYSSVLTEITDNIVANANNEITADVLRPILQAVLDFANDSIGDLSTLDTTEKGNLVDALNEVLAGIGNGITIHTGTTDPNLTPPASYSLGDFYNRTSSGSTVGFYIYNNINWVLLASFSASADYKTSVVVSSSDYIVQDADYTIMMKGSAADKTVTLPSPASYGNRILTLVNTTASYNMLLTSNVYDFDLSVLTQVGPESSMMIQAIDNLWYRLI